METFTGRLASFEVAHPVSKRRTSNAKGSKALTWPLHNLSPTELANAGFFYKPTAASPDNTCCFLCERCLDGWEEEDDAAAEHLRHSNNCGWAITMNAAPEGFDVSTLEDPTGPRMSEARKATFAIGWPHESKRGWTCKSQKMADAGWYYCPTPECDDFVSCVYCKLSLDGWEPKDNPFDEHYRRSPDCAFFAFAGVSAPKASKARKGRTSKASRISTQSTQTTEQSQEDSINLNDSIDVSLISQNTEVSTASKMGTKGKKTAKGKGKNTRQRKEEPAEVEDEEPTIVEIAPPRVATAKTRGKKRTSDEISNDDQDRGARESTVKPEPPRKRQATRTRESTTKRTEARRSTEGLDDPVLIESELPISKKGRGGKRQGSTTRKVSAASTASKASMRSQIPDEALEAQLEADLDRPLFDHEMVLDKPSQEVPKNTRGKKKGKANTASTAPTRRGRKAQTEQADSSALESMALQHVADMEDIRMTGTEANLNPPQQSKTITSKKTAAAPKRTRRAKQSDATVQSEQSILTAEPESSMVVVPAIEDGSGHETDASTTSKATLKKGGKKKTTKARPKKGGIMSKNIEDIVQSSQAAVPMPKEQETLTEAEQMMAVEDIVQSSQATLPTYKEQEMDIDVLDAEPEAAPAAMVKKTPTPPPRSPTPQSSDAENAPPSTRPESKRPPLPQFSPPKPTTTTTRVPLAASTPNRSRTPLLSPSKQPLSTTIGGGLHTTHPWTTADIETAFLASASPGKENEFAGIFGDVGKLEELSSPEKKMTVEEWIRWQAALAEEELKREAERVVGIFEAEGARALRALEGIEVCD